MWLEKKDTQFSIKVKLSLIRVSVCGVYSLLILCSTLREVCHMSCIRVTVHTGKSRLKFDITQIARDRARKHAEQQGILDVDKSRPFPGDALHIFSPLAELWVDSASWLRSFQNIANIQMRALLCGK
jgi:hypothetical protein